MTDYADLLKRSQSGEFDNEYDPETGLNGDGFTKEMVEQVLEAASTESKPMTEEELDMLLG